MDPNETLRMLRYYLALLGEPNGDAWWHVDNAQYIDEIIERIKALDEWMTNGGFNPWLVNMTDPCGMSSCICNAD